jgi:hypothetical protein
MFEDSAIKTESSIGFRPDPAQIKISQAQPENG